MGNSILGIRSVVVPMFYTSPQYVFDSYKEWVSILEVKNDVNELSFYQNISLLGMVRKITHAVEYSDMWLIIPGIVLFLLPYLRIGQYENRNFRLSFWHQFCYLWSCLVQGRKNVDMWVL